MTSQKRYRHQDGTNSGNKVRDIPPRFKRQKSSTSPTPTSTSSENPIKNTDKQDTNNSAPSSVSVPASSANVALPASALRQAHFYQLQDNNSSQNRSVLGLSPTNQPAVPDPKIWQPTQETQSVLSPWSNYYANLGVQESNHISLGTHFGYKPDNSTWMSPVVAKKQQPAINNPVWSSVDHSQANQRFNYSPTIYVTDENRMYQNDHLLRLEHSPEYNWHLQAVSYVHYPSSHIESSTFSHLTTDNRQITGSPDEKTLKSISECIDNDVRTIEMLRELERVADKESEVEESGTDRKSLVSHHLRMLMCAMDRYTEGVEDDLAVMSRQDEVSTPDSRGSTPDVTPTPKASASAIKVWPHEQTNEISRSQQMQGSFMFSPKNKMSAGDEHVFVGNQSHAPVLPDALKSSSLHKNEQKNASQEIPSWDLWCSPTFDFHALMNQTGVLRDRKDRKPLYQRQLQN